MPTALVITTAGINCDQELGVAFERAGAAAEFVHLNRLMADPAIIDGFDLVGIPGGFSYGDAIAAGRVAAQLMRRTLYGAFVRAIERGVPIIAPCNGFQIVVQMGLLPGPAPGEPWPDDPPRPTVTLGPNASACFTDRWCRVDIPARTRCLWTQGIDADDETRLLPVAHGEGRFVASSDEIIRQLAERGQVAVRYAPDDNPNGSADGIAGICDASGLVFGLMPHPERYTRWTQHPWWTRLDATATTDEPPGLRMFRNAVAHATQAAAV
ncbi:MAG: phosphoribosylformylglycinamidine synthase subunit PurQ [Planctomycetota bacterium]|jgi:phosphoribosylformylglycinamidine synthase